MNISFFEVMPGEERNIIPQLPTGHAAQFFPEKLMMETAHLAEGAEIISVFVHSELRAPLLDKLSSVKLIATRSMGFDHIDVPYARSKGIAVVNVTTYAAHPVAEFTFALLLSVTRKIYPAYHQLREGMDFDIKGLGGFNLYGKTIGIIGTGRIGRNVASIARGFGMRILACDARPDEAFAAEQGFQYVSLQQLASEADIISVHVVLLFCNRHSLSDYFSPSKKLSGCFIEKQNLFFF
jgi:D-lactate dehydrogenase